MNLIKKIKKGFTLVELAIVIAVIAILIAVLVPTFIALIDKAGESKDTQMVYNVNQALSIESASTTIETPEQALDIAEAAGYNIENLTPSSDGQIVYDSANVRFVFISTDGSIYPSSASGIDLDASTTWYFASSQEAITSTTASYIISGTWNGDLVYSGTGGLDTSRATIYGGVVTGIDGIYNSASGNAALAAKKLTEGGNSTTNIILNIVSGYAIYIYPANNVKYVIYSDADFNFSVDNISEDIYTVAKGSASFNADVEYAEGGVAIDGNLISEALADIDTTTSFVLELGVSKYPRLIASENDFTKLNEGGYCQLTANITDASAITIDSDKAVTLDLNGYALTISGTATASGSNTANIINNGNLTITDSASGGTLELSTGTYGIYNADSVEIAGGTVTVTNSSAAAYGIYSTTSSGTITISGGVFNVKATDTSTYNAYGIYQDKNAGATVNVTGGEISVSSSDTKSAYAIWSKIGATINVSGGKISASGKTTYGVYGNNSSVAINITGGEISGYYGVYAYYGILDISGGIITGQYAMYLSNETATISDVNATGSNSAIYVASSTVTISGGTFNGGTYAVDIRASVVATITGGTFAGNTCGLYINNDTSVATISDSVTITTLGKGNVELATATGDSANTTVYSLSWTASNGFASLTSSGTTTYYGSFDDARKAASDGDTVKLLKDCTGGRYIISEDITVDLNGHNWTFSSSAYTYLLSIASGSEVTLTNSSTTQSTVTYTYTDSAYTKAVMAIENYGGLSVSGNISIVATGSVAGDIDGIFAQSASKTTIGENVSIKATNSGSGGATGIVCWGTNSEDSYTTLTISGGSIYGDTFGVSGNGSYSYTNVTITDGKIEGGAVGYYHPEIGNLTISGGSIKGYYAGLQICAGTVAISGGTFESTIPNVYTSSSNVYQKTGDGAIADGAALSVINRCKYGTYLTTGYSVTSVKVTGGTFISASGEAVQFYTFTESEPYVSAITDQTIVSVTGGQFSSALTGDYSAYCVASGYSVSTSVNSNNYYEVSTSN